MTVEDIRYCPRCGTTLIEEIHFGKPRPVCPACRWIYFADPKVAVAVLVYEENNVLLVRRANEPQRGLWTLPAGFVDAGEDPREAAVRECFEETGLKIKVSGLHDVLFGQEHPKGAHILIVYLGKVLSGELRPEDDVDRAAFFDVSNLPELAFETTRNILR